MTALKWTSELNKQRKVSCPLSANCQNHVAPAQKSNLFTVSVQQTSGGLKIADELSVVLYSLSMFSNKTNKDYTNMIKGAFTA